MGWRKETVAGQQVDVKTIKGKPVRVQSVEEIPARTEIRIDDDVFVTGGGQEHVYGWTAPLIALEDMPPVKVKSKVRVKANG